MNYWLLKSEPFKYSWEQLLKDGETFWDGVRNYQARNNLREMKAGDQALFYHSNEGLCVVGIAEIIREAYQDPTTENPQWVSVDIKPMKALKTPVTLADMKQIPQLENMSLIRQSRLSVCPVTKAEFDFIVKMGSE